MSKKLRVFFAQVSPPGQFKLFTPPLGLLYLAAYLRERFALDIRVVNQRLEGLTSDQLVQQIADFEPDIVGLGCMTPSAHILPGLTKALRAASPKTLIILGGPHISAVRESVLEESCADIAIAGEGELALEQVFQAHLSGSGFSQIPGLIHRNADGEIIVNPGATPIVEDLDSLPFPAYDLIDIKQYWNTRSLVPIPRQKYITMFSSRGCPYGCIYCNEIFGRRYRAHSPERMVEEVKHYANYYAVNEIEYVDDCFNLKSNRVTNYATLLLKEFGPIRTALSGGARADLLNEDVVEALKQTGMYYVGLPLESGSQRIQQLIHKNLEIQKFPDAVRMCVERHIFTNGVAMFGFPTETVEEMESTIRMVSDSQLHTCVFFIATPFPNTELYNYAMAHTPEKMSSISYNDIEFEQVRVNLSAASTREFTRVYARAPFQFYSRPSRLIRIARDYPNRCQLPFKGLSYMGRAIKSLTQTA